MWLPKSNEQNKQLAQRIKQLFKCSFIHWNCSNALRSYFKICIWMFKTWLLLDFVCLFSCLPIFLFVWISFSAEFVLFVALSTRWQCRPKFIISSEKLPRPEKALINHCHYKALIKKSPTKLLFTIFTQCIHVVYILFIYLFYHKCEASWLNQMFTITIHINTALHLNASYYLKKYWT